MILELVEGFIHETIRLFVENCCRHSFRLDMAIYEDGGGIYH